MPYEAHERLRSHRGADLTGKLRVSACAWFDYIMLEFFVGRTVSKGRGFGGFSEREKPGTGDEDQLRASVLFTAAQFYATALALILSITLLIPLHSVRSVNISTMLP